MHRFRFPGQIRIICVVIVLVLVTACGDTATAPTAPPAMRTVGNATVSPTSGSSNATPTSDVSSTPVGNTLGEYELVARRGEPAPVLVPIGVEVLRGGSVAVADIEGSRVAIFGPDGNLETTWSAEGTWNIVAAPEGQLYMLRSRGEPVILAYDRDGSLLRRIDIPVGPAGGGWVSIPDMVVASDGSIFITSGIDSATGVDPAPLSGVLVLGPTGDERARWTAPEGMLAQHVTVSDDGMVSVVIIPDQIPAMSPSPSQFPTILVRFDSETGPPDDWLEAELPLTDEIQIDAMTIGLDGMLLAVHAAGIHQEEPDTTQLYAINTETGEVVEIAALDERRGAGLISSDITTNADGEMFLTDPLSHRVLRLNPDCNVIGELGGVEPDQLGVPGGLTIGPDGDVLVYDTATSRVLVFGRGGTHRTSWEVPRDRPYSPGTRGDIAVADDGTVVVTDDAPGRAIVLSEDGEVISDWTLPINLNAEPGHPMIFSPDRIALFNGSFYVTFAHAPIIASYSLQGDAVDTWPVEFTQALGVAATDDAVYALVLVEDGIWDGSPILTAGEAEAQVQRLAGEEVDVIASLPLGNLREARPDFFPFSFTVAPDGSIFLADPFNRQIMKLGAEGNEVGQWAIGGDEYLQGSSLALAADETRLYVADVATRQVLVFEAME